MAGDWIPSGASCFSARMTSVPLGPSGSRNSRRRCATCAPPGRRQLRYVSACERDDGGARLFSFSCVHLPALRLHFHEPPINLTLNQTEAPPVPRLPAHFGIQVKSTDELVARRRVMEAFGHAGRSDEGVGCCYAVQDKVWFTGPDGHPWEVFVVTQGTPPRPRMSMLHAWRARPPYDRRACLPATSRRGAHRVNHEQVLHSARTARCAQVAPWWLSELLSGWPGSCCGLAYGGRLGPQLPRHSGGRLEIRSCGTSPPRARPSPPRARPSPPRARPRRQPRSQPPSRRRRHPREARPRHNPRSLRPRSHPNRQSPAEDESLVS